MDSNSTDTQSWWTQHEPWWTFLFIIIEACLCVGILIGNGLVIVAYNRIKRFHNNNLTHFFLIHLAASDFIVGVALMVKVASHFLQNVWISPYRCVLQFATVGMPLVTSALLLLLITTERYYSIMNPYHDPESFGKLPKYGLIMLAWLISMVVMVLTPFLWMKSAVHTNIDCDLVNNVDDEYWKYVILPLTYALLLAVSAMYTKILVVAKHQMDRIQLLVVQVPQADKTHMRNAKLVKTGFMLLGLFLICWLPFTIILTITMAGPFFQDTPLAVLRFCSATLATLSSALNPLIYAARIRRFRVEIKRILRLPIKFSDKCETYEIKRTFRIRNPLSSQNPSSNNSKANDSVKTGSRMNAVISESNESEQTSEITESTSTDASGASDSYTSTTTTLATVSESITTGHPYRYSTFENRETNNNIRLKNLSKPAVQVTKSSPLTVRERWVSRSKIERAATENNGKKPVMVRRNAVDEQDYIAVTVTRIVQDLSDSDEDLGLEDIRGDNERPSQGNVNRGVEYEDAISKAVPRLTHSHSFTRSLKKIERNRQDRAKQLPMTEQSEQTKPSSYKFTRKRSLKSCKRGFSSEGDNATLEEILCDGDIVRSISNHSNCLNFLVETDQINLELKSSKPEVAKTVLGRSYSQSRRRFASTKKYKVPKIGDVGRAKSLHVSANNPHLNLV